MGRNPYGTKYKNELLDLAVFVKRSSRKEASRRPLSLCPHAARASRVRPPRSCFLTAPYLLLQASRALRLHLAATHEDRPVADGPSRHPETLRSPSTWTSIVSCSGQNPPPPFPVLSHGPSLTLLDLPGRIHPRVHRYRLGAAPGHLPGGDPAEIFLMGF